MNVREPYYSLLRSGVKSVEGRLHKGIFKDWYERIQRGETIHLTITSSGDRSQSFEASIIGARSYDTFEELLVTEGLRHVLPNIRTLADGINVYRQFYTAENEQQYGTCAFYMKSVVAYH